MPADARAKVRRTAAATGLPIVAVDSSIRLTGTDPGPELRRFLELASDCESPLVPARRTQLESAARVLLAQSLCPG
jgi:hypothetical protein